MHYKAFVETTKKSMIRTRYNEKTFQKIESFQVNHEYPYDYGFIVNTDKIQKDCLDCYFITNRIMSEGSFVECDVIGMIEMVEDDEIDHKLLLKCLDDDGEVKLEFVYASIKDHIETIFKKFPDVRIKIGDLVGKVAAENFINFNLKSEFWKLLICTGGKCGT